MERRIFFKNIGLGIGSSLLNQGAKSQQQAPAVFKYPGIQSLADATNEQGEVALRLAWQNDADHDIEFDLQIEVEGGASSTRTKCYFIEPPDQCFSHNVSQSLHLDPADGDVLVAWILQGTETTLVRVQTGSIGNHQFTLGEVLKKGELQFGEKTKLTINLLGYREVGRMTLTDLHIQDQEKFRFTIMADPQGGDPRIDTNDAPTRMKIHNAFVEETVKRITELDPPSLFTLILGDFVDSKGQQGNFLHMEDLIKPLRHPILLEVGNHESPYRADFTPAYNMTDLDNFFASQKRVNGLEKILYSFDLGQWHLVVWPDPLRHNFWSTHPHYFDWLEKDLEHHKDRSVIFMHHVPLHPIGIDPLTSYVESTSVKQLLVDILSRHGNVKLVVSGHVHIPLRASLKTAVTYRGMKMINLPAAGFRPRAFGEPDFFGGPEQGVGIIDINGGKLKVHFQSVTREWFTYPETLPDFDDHNYALWFQQPWELPIQSSLVNGDFLLGLDSWHQRYVYTEDQNPSNIREVRSTSDGKKALYLYSRKRDYDTPGQDRLPQHINRIVQCVSLEGKRFPELSLTYLLDETCYDSTSLNGLFIWLECYRQAHQVANLIYAPGKVYGSLTKRFGRRQLADVLYFDLPAKEGQWHQVSLPLAKDFKSADERSRTFQELHADRMLIYLGTWTVNEGLGQEAGVFIREILLAEGNEESPTTPKKSDKDIWYSRIDHVAGDHQYADQALVYPFGLRGEKSPT